MPFYEDMKPKKKMSRAEHLRQESERAWEEEGTRYRSHAKSSPRREDVPTYAKNGKGGASGKYSGKNHEDARERGKKPESRPSNFPAHSKPLPNDRKPQKHDAPKPAPLPAEKEAFLPENLLSGRNPIREALKSGRDIEKLLVAKGELSGTAREIVAMAKERHIPVQVVERSRLDEITKNHQGMLAFASAYRYYDVEDMLADAAERNEMPFLVVLDGVTDPMNLGAVIRTAACVGAHGVIVPERRAVGLTPSAVKASAGAIETVKVARVTNLTRTLEMLKKQGIWLYAADMNGEDYRKVDFARPMALIVGAEGDGVSRLVMDASDYRVSLPMKGGVGSLNASVAAGVLLYAALSCRG